MNIKMLKVGLPVFVLILLLAGCTDIDESSNDDNLKDEQYDWSLMNEGPYRDKVSYATSSDLITWTDSEMILAEHASVPGAIYKNGVIYVYFVDVSVDGIAERTGLIRSEDEDLISGVPIVI